MTALSPGPWRIEDHEYFTAILDRDGRKIAEVYVSRERNVPLIERIEQRRANASAMARAGGSF